MDRESKFRMVLLLAAAAVTAVVLTGLYSARPLEFYQVTVEATPARRRVLPGPAHPEPAGETIPVEEEHFQPMARKRCWWKRAST